MTDKPKTCKAAKSKKQIVAKTVKLAKEYPIIGIINMEKKKFSLPNKAKKLMEEPMEHSKWANYIIIFSVLSGLNLLALIGGILASVYNPPSRGVSPQFALPKTQQPQTRICAQCGTITVEDAYFCPSCGKRLS